METKQRILIVNPGGLPVPDVKGGAVQSLTTVILDQNEIYGKADLFSYGPYDEEASQKYSDYKNTNFITFKVPKIITWLDRLIYNFFALFSSHPQSFGRILKSFYYVSKLKHHLMINDYDRVVFEHNHILLLVFKNKKVYQKYKNKYFIHIHNKVRALKTTKQFISSCPLIITVSNYMKEYLINEPTLRIKSQSIAVLYNCVDTNLFKKMIIPQTYGKSYGFDESKINLLFAGRINKEKGILEVLELIEQLGDEYKLIVVGDVFYSAKERNGIWVEIEEKYKDSINSGKICFTGYINRNDMPSVYNMADIIILPSMWDEPAGLTMLEAVLCEKPLITTNSGGIPEYVGGCSIVVDKKNIVDNMKIAVENINNYQFKYDELKDRFTADLYYKRFLSIVLEKNE